MRVALITVLVLSAFWAKPGSAELSLEQAKQAEAFMAGVRALDPHTEQSERGFLALVEKYVPASGSVQAYLEFMTAGGFECPPISSLAYEGGSLVFHCTFEPDLGSRGEPNLSSVSEVSWFGVTAHSDDERNVLSVTGYMTHGLIGP